MKGIWGLFCQHDFERLFQPGEIRPLVDPRDVHPFWHLKHQRQLEEEAIALARKIAREDALEGTFFEHFPEDSVALPARSIVPAAISAAMPFNEYLGDDDKEILREMSPQAVIIQEPLHRPQFVKQQARKKQKRTHAEIRHGLGPLEEIVLPLAPSGRVMTGAEVATQRAQTAEKTARRNAVTCDFCKKPGHNRRGCQAAKTERASSQLASSGTPSSQMPERYAPGASVFLNTPRSSFPTEMLRSSPFTQRNPGILPYGGSRAAYTSMVAPSSQGRPT